MKQNIDQEVVNNIAIAVVRQAVDDWRKLCKGKPETKNRNFIELANFFENDCANYLVGTNTTADRIYKLLKRERQKFYTAQKAGV